MSRRMPVLLAATWLAVPGLAMAEEELTPEKWRRSAATSRPRRTR